MTEIPLTRGDNGVTAPAIRPQAQPAVLDDERIETLRQTIARELRPDEFRLFVAVCNRTGLDPLAKQIYAIRSQNRLVLHVGIDGLRLIAERSGKYGGQIGPLWADASGTWHDVWLDDSAPAAAKVGVVRKDWREPVWGVARLKSYRRQSPNWQEQPDVMLAKCAEAVALRKAFPNELAFVPAYQSEHDEQAAEFGIDTSGEPMPAAERPSLTEPEAEYRVVNESTGEITETAGPAAGADSSASAGPTQIASQPPAGNPPPPWHATPLGRSVLALGDALAEAGKRFSLPGDEAGEEDLRGWLASKKPLLAGN